MEQITLGQVYDILCRSTVDDEKICYLCLISVSPISKQYLLSNAVIRKIELNDYGLTSLYYDTATGCDMVRKYLLNPISGDGSGFVNYKLQKMRGVYQDYLQTSWYSFNLKVQKRRKIIEMRNQKIPAQYVFDLAYDYFAKNSKNPQQTMREKLLEFIK